ncbi:MAG: T9SS type A sorting domain-containing protein, partial [Bacteroidota bacterium]|nr:T9SS type A sorting domain-containing protein [Bacteroidota bacterium]
QHQYSYNDNSPLKGANYYRLRIVDGDGRFVYSKTITVNFNGTSLFALYPNPAVDVVHLRFSLASSATITVFDMNGKALMQKTISGGSSSQNINVSALAAGIYTVVLQQKDQKQTLRFEKK